MGTIMKEKYISSIDMFDIAYIDRNADLKNKSLFLRELRMVTLQCSGMRHFEQIHKYPRDGDRDKLINAPMIIFKVCSL